MGDALFTIGMLGPFVIAGTMVGASITVRWIIIQSVILTLASAWLVYNPPTGGGGGGPGLGLAMSVYVFAAISSLWISGLWLGAGYRWLFPK